MPLTSVSVGPDRTTRQRRDTTPTRVSPVRLGAHRTRLVTRLRTVYEWAPPPGPGHRGAHGARRLPHDAADAAEHPRPRTSPVSAGATGNGASGTPTPASRQWTVWWWWHISTNFAMRAARVSGFLASWTR